MKKGVMAALLLGILLVSPLIQAQIQSQAYSGFDRFIDNIRLFFSFGDNKVRMALSIKEKEINSSIENFKNGNEKDSSANLERAWERLQFIQEKVSRNTAGEVKENSNNTRNRIIQEGNLTKDFEVYVLEEEKTELTAEWVIEMNGTEGQNKTWEIETRIDKIDGEISNWVVEHSVEGEEGDEGLVRVVKTEVAQGDNGLKPEVKTYVQGDETQNDEPLPEPDLNQINPDAVPGDTTTNNIDEGDGGEGDYAEGTTAEGNSGSDADETGAEEPAAATP